MQTSHRANIIATNIRIVLPTMKPSQFTITVSKATLPVLDQ